MKFNSSPRNSLLIRGLLLPLLLLAPANLSAQEEETVSIQFAAVAWEETIRGLFYFDAGEPKPIIVLNGSPGERFPYEGPPNLTFFRKTTNPEGEAIYTPVASVPVPPEERDLLLLFIGRNNPGELKIVAMPDSRDNFGAGGFYFQNLTSRRVALRVGDATMTLAPRELEIVQTSPDRTQNVDVRIASSDAENNWSLVYESRWGPPRNRRIWVFLHGGVDGRPEIKRYYEFVE